VLRQILKFTGIALFTAIGLLFCCLVRPRATSDDDDDDDDDDDG
jgi:hypothetical protein